jgi:hypothetical protein
MYKLPSKITASILELPSKHRIIVYHEMNIREIKANSAKSNVQFGPYY